MVDLVNGLGGPRGFGENLLARNDDGSTASIDVSSIFESGLNFFGETFSSLFVNNNGSVTFNAPRSTFTPTVITEISNNPEITPFFADVDTSDSTGQLGADQPASLPPTPGGTSTGSDLVWYDLDTAADRLVVTWDDVGFFFSDTSKLNAFQLILQDRGAGNFDIEFRYEAINWTTGDASGGQDGLGGTVARAGYTAGTGDPAEFFELPQSGDEAGILALDSVPGNTGQIGRWLFSVQSGLVGQPVDIQPVQASRLEGNTGTTPFTFEVTRTGDTTQPLTLNWTVAPRGADPAEPEDFAGGGVPLVTTQSTTTIPSTGQPLTVSLSLPDGTTATSVGASGLVSSGAVPSSTVNIAYVVDISGSTFTSDFAGTNPVGDRNGDGDPNDIIDAIIASFDVLNQQIAALELGAQVNVGLIPFASESQIISVQPPDRDSDGNGVFDVIDILSTVDSTQTIGGIDIGGSGTDFKDGLAQAASFFSGQPAGDNFVFFLSDGENGGGDFSSEVAALLDPTIGAEIRAIGVGSGSDLTDLDLVDDGIANGSATQVLDPDQLTPQLTQSPISAADVARVEILRNGALVQTIPGNALNPTPFGLAYTTSISGLDPQATDEITARVVATDAAATSTATTQDLEALNPASQFPSGTVTIGPGRSSQTLVVDVLGETLIEGDEGFAVTLSQFSSPVQFVNASADGLIRNDDPLTPQTGPIGILRGSARDDGMLIVQGATYLGQGGDDFYLISRAVAPNQISIVEDTGGLIQLIGGLEIASSRVALNAVELTLANNAVVRILGASSYEFEVSGNATIGARGTVLGFQEFAQTVLGVTPPASGFALGGAVTIGGGAPGTLLDGAGTVTATAGPDEYVLRVDDSTGQITNPDFEGQLTLDGFDPAQDVIRFQNVPGSSVTEADILNATGLTVIEDVFAPAVRYVLGPDPRVGAQGAEIVVPGIADQDADQNGVLDFIEVI